MLVLTRKPGQSIMIGDDIEVQILSVAGDKVRIGITAPRDVGIFRDEVYDRIEADRDETRPERPASSQRQRLRLARAVQRVPFEG